MSASAGRFIIVSGPSGVGKTSLLNEAVASSTGLRLSISHTTRAPREDEKDGENYFFVSDKRFLAMAKGGAFLEYASVFNHYYGTSKQFVNTCLANGDDVVLEIDWQGAQQVRRAQKCFSVFILPPSLSALKTRLRNRKRDQPAVIKRRLAGALTEIKHCLEFEQWIVNDDYRRASHELAQVLSQRSRDEGMMRRARKTLRAIAQEDARLAGLF